MLARPSITLCNSKTHNDSWKCKYRSSFSMETPENSLTSLLHAWIRVQVSFFPHYFVHFSVTLEGNTLTLLGKPQNNISRNCKERAQTLLLIFGNKLVLVYCAVVWVREKRVIISNSSAWTRQGGGKIKGRFERKLTLRRLMSCIYGAPILDVSRSHTTRQHSR